MENRERSEDMSGPVKYWLLGMVPADKQMRPMRSGVNGGLRKKTEKEMKPSSPFHMGPLMNISKNQEARHKDHCSLARGHTRFSVDERFK